MNHKIRHLPAWTNVLTPNVIHMKKLIVLVAEAIMVSFFQFQLFLGKTRMLLWTDHANRKRLI